jgi:Activator of Hsp90 ATPase homolog 1-like protein
LSAESLPAISHKRFLRCSAQHAFAVYTGRIGEWWDPNYSANAETLRSVTIEPRVGGRVFATHEDLGEHDWGEVTVWEAGERFAHTFTLAQDPQAPSEVRVEFADDEGGCDLRFAHGGWTEANAADRAKFNDWPVLLERFAQLAEASA